MKKLIPWKLYKQIIGNVPIACVDVAIVAKGSVLLVRRKDHPAKGQWWLPGGRVLKGEMMKIAAARKARDEVGIECHVGPIVHTAETIFPDGPGGVSIHSINSITSSQSSIPSSSPSSSRIPSSISRSPSSSSGSSHLIF